MPNILTTDDLIERARDIAGVPDTEVPGTDDSAVLRYLNDVILEKVTPQVMRAKQSYFTRNHLITLVSGKSKYRIPHRAIELKFDNIIHRSTSGSKPSFNPLTKIDHEQRYMVMGEDNIPRYFYVEGNYLVLVPEQASTFTGFLETPYFIRPGRLVLRADCALVTDVDTATKTVTLDSLPTDFTDADSYDVHAGVSGGEIKCMDLTVDSIDSMALTITFNEEIDGSVFGSHPVEIGDYIAFADTACIPALPREVEPILVQAAVVKLSEAQGDAQLVQTEVALLNDKLKDMTSTIKDRVDSKPERIMFPGILRAWR